MTKEEHYTDFFEELGITDNTRREYIMGTLYQLANLIIKSYETEDKETGRCI